MHGISIAIVSLLLQQCVATPDGMGGFTSNCPLDKSFVDAPNGDFHLLRDNPGIGRAVCLPEVLQDLDHNLRPSRPPNTLFVGDTGCDIGAYQFIVVPSPASTVTTSVTGIVTVK